MKARIHCVVFDRRERPLHAVILTAKGIVEVQWKCVAGDWCWFTAGTGEAKKLAVSAIERIPRCFGKNAKVRQSVRCRYCGRTSEDGSGVCARCERSYE
jgi:hypothetical protein